MFRPQSGLPQEEGDYIRSDTAAASFKLVYTSCRVELREGWNGTRAATVTLKSPLSM